MAQNAIGGGQGPPLPYGHRPVTFTAQSCMFQETCPRPGHTKGSHCPSPAIRQDQWLPSGQGRQPGATPTAMEGEVEALWADGWLVLRSPKAGGGLLPPV